MKLIDILEKINKEFEIKIELGYLFEHPTLEAVVNYISKKENNII